MNVQTYDGNTPLHIAVGHGMGDMTYFLISQGADPDIPNRQDEHMNEDSGDRPQAKEITEASLTKEAQEQPKGETAFTLARGNEKVTISLTLIYSQSVDLIALLYMPHLNIHMHITPICRMHNLVPRVVTIPCDEPVRSRRPLIHHSHDWNLLFSFSFF